MAGIWICRMHCQTLRLAYSFDMYHAATAELELHSSSSVLPGLLVFLSSTFAGRHSWHNVEDSAGIVAGCRPDLLRTCRKLAATRPHTCCSSGRGSGAWVQAAGRHADTCVKQGRHQCKQCLPHPVCTTLLNGGLLYKQRIMQPLLSRVISESLSAGVPLYGQPTAI